MTTETLYTFEHDGEVFDLEQPDRAKLEAFVDEWYAEQYRDEGAKNGDTFASEGFVIAFHYGDDGERVEISRERLALRYEHYHGDYAEHNTHWGAR